MTQDLRDPLLMRLRRAAAAIFAIGAMATGTVHASPPSTVVVVPHADLRALARQDGEAMLLHETIDGRMMLYIEQNQGGSLATFDVPGPMTDALTVTHPTMDTAPVPNFGAIDTLLSYELDRMFDVKQVRAQMTRTDTGTTFMLTQDGLYVIRHPAVEWIHQLMAVPTN